MKDASAKENIAKSIGSVEDPMLMDLETGAFKPRKAKKEKTPVELALANLKSFEKKILYCKLMVLTLYIQQVSLCKVCLNMYS